MATTAVVLLTVFCVALPLFTFVPTLKASETLEPKVYKCANGSAKTNEICLKSTLLKDYDISMRPVKHHSNQTTVYLALFPLRIDMNYYLGSLRIQCWIQKRWVDEWLKWDPKEYQDLEQLSLSPSSIWQPDVHPLPLKGSEGGWSSSSLATIVPNGTVNSVSTMSFFTNCEAHVSRWPHDRYNCVLTLQSQAHKGSELNVLLMDYKIPELLKYFVPDHDWTLESMDASRVTTAFHESNYFVVNLEFTFIIKRQTAMLETTAIFPAVVFSMTQLAFFCLDKESSVRLILCSMAAITHSFFLTVISKDIPSEGEFVPYIVKFYKHCLLLSVCMLVWTTVAQYISLLSTFPSWLNKATLHIHKNRFLSPLMPFDEMLGNTINPGTDDADTLVAQAEGENRQWRNMVEFLDRIMFIACFLIYLFLYIMYIP